MKYKGKLITGDFDKNTMTFEIEGEMKLQAGTYQIEQVAIGNDEPNSFNNKKEQLSPDLERGDFVEYKGGSNSQYLTKGKKYRLTGSMWGEKIPIEADSGKRMTTLQRYFKGV